MTRKLTPQEHLENIIIQQNKDQPVNQYTALLHNPGAKRWERPKEVTTYGGGGNYSFNELFALALIAPVLYFFWFPGVAMLGYVTGYFNSDSKVCLMIDDEMDCNWLANQALALFGLFANFVTFGLFIGMLLTGHPFMCILASNIAGGIWIIAREFISQRKMFKDIDSWD